MKDLYYFLDAVKLLERDAWLTEGEQHDLHEWFGRYLDWLQTSPQGREERAAKANHGTYYDLQVAAVAAYLGEARLVRETLRDSRSRILQQFDVTGAQPGEMARTNTAHYCCFNLQGWIHLAQLAEAFNEDLWSFQASDGRGIQRAMEWVLRHIGRPWPYPQLDAFDDERFYPIHYARVARYGEPSEKTSVPIPPANCLKPVFHPFYGIMPFWQLASPGVASAESSVTTA